MKTVILAGGLGTRLAEETEVRPKPMIEIGGRPILWHILEHYSGFGCREFLIALGYRSEVIKRYFLDYHGLSGDMSISLGRGEVEVHGRECKDWTIRLIDTGLHTNTGGRLKRLAPWLRDEPFMVTYGDGVGDVNITELIDFHRRHARKATVTAVRPPARFGGLEFRGERVARFTEKPQSGEGWINGGFFVFEPSILDDIEGDETSLERNVLERLAARGELSGYRHHGFWQCMDTLRDKRYLESLWQQGNVPWKASA